MPKSKLYFKRIVAVLPVTAIIAASFFPIQTWGQQALILFALIWFNVFILFDVLGK